MTNSFYIIENNFYLKETIGFAILDQVPLEDHPAIYDFAKIIFNYQKMSEKIDELKEDQNKLNKNKK